MIIIGYTFLLYLLCHQMVNAHERYSFTWRQCHGKRVIYVRSRKTGRVVLHTRNVWDLLSLGV